MTSIPIRRFATIDSTNLEARRLVQQGERGSVWIQADEQRQGRGRLERTWVSEPGNLYSTLLLSTAASPRHVPQLGFVVALALYDLAREFAPGQQIGLKWPNDCLINGAKVAGILCELLGENPTMTAIGCGINVGNVPLGLSYPATSLGQFTAGLQHARVFQSYRFALSKRLSTWASGEGFAAISKEWEKHAIGLGDIIVVTAHGTSLSGIFVGLAQDGALRMTCTDQTEHSIYAGDITIPSLDRLRLQTT